MSEPVLLPKFLTHGMVARVVARVVGMVTDDAYFPIKHQMLHIVVLVLTRKSSWPRYPEPYILYEHSVGDRLKWPHPFDEIARSKSAQLWYDQNDGRTDIMPHLLFQHDTPYWGGVKRDGIVVTCSGVQPWFDKMISGMIADVCIAMAYDAWMTSQDKQDGVDLLT